MAEREMDAQGVPLPNRKSIIDSENLWKNAKNVGIVMTVLWIFYLSDPELLTVSVPCFCEADETCRKSHTHNKVFTCINTIPRVIIENNYGCICLFIYKPFIEIVKEKVW